VLRGLSSDLMTRPEQDKDKLHFLKEPVNQGKKFQMIKLTEVAGRINLSKAWRAQFNPRSRMLHAAQEV
jgi:hypothetical protein